MRHSMPAPSALLTDLYEFTMAQAYFREEMFAPATFSLFIRDVPAHRGYFVNAGLDEALTFLETMRYSRSDLDILHETGLFEDDFLHHLSSLVFSGNMHALAALPPAHKRVRNPDEYPVDISERLRARQREAVQAVREKELGES